MAKASLEYGIQECSKCQYKLRCDECVYNEKDMAGIIEFERQEVSKETANKYQKRIEELENRVKELEDGIAKSMLGCEFLPECTNETLKQFAERLKEKIDEKQLFLVAVSSVRRYLDETLKEFLK